MRRFSGRLIATTLSILLLCLMANATAGTSEAPVKVIQIGELGSSGQKARLKSMATKKRVDDVQAYVRANPAIMAYLRQRGISLRNVVVRVVAGNGRTILYVR